MVIRMEFGESEGHVTHMKTQVDINNTTSNPE